MEQLTQTEERSRVEREYYALNARVYAGLAPYYEPLTLPLRRLRKEVVSASDATSDSRVLDVATGTGAQARAFADRCKEVVGVDISEDMLRIARHLSRFPSLDFRRADATALPFEAASFDVSCISFALHEMPPTVRETVLREMMRVTKSAGVLVLVDYALPRDPVLGRVVYEGVKLYERDRYAEFIRSDFSAVLGALGLDVDRQPDG
jgi:demethylmenaquinone methyltransferase/2-methoxy-6-polyprenyl-1,4-benzoquinol methylase